jgi:hypothetical protein
VDSPTNDGWVFVLKKILLVDPLCTDEKLIWLWQGKFMI